jgi:hypothetical protein
MQSGGQLFLLEEVHTHVKGIDPTPGGWRFPILLAITLRRQKKNGGKKKNESIHE